VKKIQAGYKVQPLSAYLNKPAPPAQPLPDFPKFTDAAFKKDVFAYLNFLLQFCPAVPEETELRARFAEIGVSPGKSFDFEKLSLEDKLDAGLGIKLGYDKIEKQRAEMGNDENGWRVSAAFGDRAFYNGDWLLRAAAALAGIYGNDAVEAMYPATTTDLAGRKLDGSKYSYALTFPVGQLPPVTGFWSVTMYDGKTQLLVANPINRYLINSQMLSGMKENPDGSLTLYIQKDSPGTESNWLPAPDGPIYLVMRLYWPKDTPPSILPPGEGTWKPPGVKRVE
jgi:hypothetical protein